MYPADNASPPSVTFSVPEVRSLALECHRRGLHAEAEMLYRRILEVTPTAADILHFLAGVCHQQQRPEEALALIDQVVDLEPGNADACNNRGNILEGLGRSDEAEASYRAALAANPDHAPAHNNLGVLLLAQRRTDEALEQYRRAVALAPESADYHYNLGNALRKTGVEKSGEAEGCYRAALAANPEYAPAHSHLADLLLDRHQPDEALEHYRRAVVLAPGDVDYHFSLGNALRKLGDLQGAVEAYRGALALNPRHDGSWQGLSRCLLLADRKDLAREAYEQWLKVDPDNPQVSYFLSAHTGEGVPPRAPDTYIEAMFDGISARFDDELADLEYRAPGLLAETLASLLGTPEGSLDILDAGCGTGLCGPLLRPSARRLTGVDLSSGMLDQAAGRSVYDDLHRAELTAFIGSQGNRYDVIASADTLCYFGDLMPVFAASAGALRPGGYLAFTLEDAGDGTETSLLTVKGRYQHAGEYVARTLAETGFTVISRSAVSLRNESGKPVAGHLVVAQLSHSSLQAG